MNALKVSSCLQNIAPDLLIYASLFHFSDTPSLLPMFWRYQNGEVKKVSTSLTLIQSERSC